MPDPLRPDLLRIAIGGFLHESHSFAPVATTYADFLAAGESPALARGAGMVAALRDTSWPISGAVSAKFNLLDTVIKG